MNVYVFDSGPLINMFRHYYRQRFPSLWDLFDDMVKQKYITSTREVLNELTNYDDELAEWCRNNRQVFRVPNTDELNIVRNIFIHHHFQSAIRKKKRLEGNPVADPFVIARASFLDGYVVTTESYKPNATKIPNICKKFSVDCINLEQFMEREGWQF